MSATLESRLHSTVARVRAHWKGIRFLDGLEPGPDVPRERGL